MFKIKLIPILIGVVLSAIFVLVGCEDMKQNMMSVTSETGLDVQIEDVSDDVITLPEPSFVDVPRINVADAIIQDKIAGQWIWMIAPTEAGIDGSVSIDIDSLAIVTNDTITEADIATNGANIGDMVGDLAWTLGSISATDDNNVTEVVNKIGLAVVNNNRLDYHSSYALIVIVSDTDQSDLTMRVGSDDAIKVWLNNEVVHKNAIDRGSTGFQDNFKIDLKKGNNLLLVKVSNGIRDWTMFVGIEKDDTDNDA